MRTYLLSLEEVGHNEGRRHACYRALKTFLMWWEDEIEPEDWKNSICKVKAPKVSIKPIEPVDLATIKSLLETCKSNRIFDLRDKAIILTLMDTGARASELVSMNLDDMEISGAVLIRKGKGGKPSTVFGQENEKSRPRVS